MPSESLVVTAGVFAAAGDQSLALVIAAAALGAFLGDHVSYAVGSFAGDRLIGRICPGTRKAPVHAWAAKVLAERGGTVIWPDTSPADARRSRSPPARFTIRCRPSASSTASRRRLGGSAFEDEPLTGVLFGLGLALCVAGAIELVRRARRRPARADPP